MTVGVGDGARAGAVVTAGGGGGGSLGTLAGGIEVVAVEDVVEGATAGTGGTVLTIGLLVGVAGEEGLKAGSELSIESLRSAYPLIC